MSVAWTRDAIVLFIKKDLLLERLDLESTGLTLETIADDAVLLGDGLALDSVDALDLLVGVEKRFGLEMADMGSAFIAQTCRSVATLADYVQARLAEKDAVPAA